MRWKILGITAFALLIAAFTVVNSIKVEVNFLLTTARINLIFVILLSVLLGMILSTALWSAQTLKWRRKTKELNASILELQDQVKHLKATSPTEIVKDVETSSAEESDLHTAANYETP